MVDRQQIHVDREAGELALGFGVRNAPSVDIAKIAKVCGFDWLFIDMEHGSLDLATAVQISVAAQAARTTPSLRAVTAARVSWSSRMPTPRGP